MPQCVYDEYHTGRNYWPGTAFLQMTAMRPNPTIPARGLLRLLCYTILYRILLYYTLLYYIIQYNTTLYYTPILYYTKRSSLKQLSEFCPRITCKTCLRPQTERCRLLLMSSPPHFFAVQVQTTSHCEPLQSRSLRTMLRICDSPSLDHAVPVDSI